MTTFPTNYLNFLLIEHIFNIYGAIVAADRLSTANRNQT